MGKSGALSRQHGRGKTRRGRTNTDPLRLVVGEEVNEGGHVREVLECGHRVGIREDWIGRTHAERRRCPYCGDEQRKKETEAV